MFVKKLDITNFRLFKHGENFSIENINTPDGSNEGSGLTTFVGENSCGKSAILDALALPVLPYKADSFSLDDLNNPKKKSYIKITANSPFKVSGTMPKGDFKAKGFLFEGGLRARSSSLYLSSLTVSYQYFIKADGEANPKDGSPDLRVDVDNPYKGRRFKENDILFLDKNRTFQTRTGTYNPTRFDKLMEDFNYQYLKGQEKVKDLNIRLSDVYERVENQFLKDAIEKFKEITGINASLNFLDNMRPFAKGFFAETKENKQSIKLDRQGSGYEMIFSLLYSFYLSQQSGKDLIILIDEPELHMHPKLQEKLVGLMLELSKKAQIVVATHSPLFIKHLAYNEHNSVRILRKKNESTEVVSLEERLLPYVSASETNYLAFNLPTEEHHNELYEELKYIHGENKYFIEFDTDYFQKKKGEKPKFPWKKQSKKVSEHTYIRNQIHHSKSMGKPLPDRLLYSIKKLRKYLSE